MSIGAQLHFKPSLSLSLSLSLSFSLSLYTANTPQDNKTTHLKSLAYNFLAPPSSHVAHRKKLCWCTKSAAFAYRAHGMVASAHIALLDCAGRALSHQCARLRQSPRAVLVGVAAATYKTYKRLVLFMPTPTAQLELVAVEWDAGCARVVWAARHRALNPVRSLPAVPRVAHPLRCDACTHCCDRHRNLVSTS